MIDRTWSVVLLLLTISEVADAFNATNSSGLIDKVQCVYPLSGQYGLLPRLLYYSSLIFAIVWRYREWLVVGALASALSYSGAAAIHALILANSRKGVYDLDILGVWAILSTGALAYITLIHWSSTLRNSRAKFVMLIWGGLVGVGLIFGRTEIYDSDSDNLTSTEPSCYSSSGTLLTTRSQLEDPRFNCTYACFARRKPMREPAEITAIPASILSGKYSSLGVALLGPVMFAAYASMSWDSRQHSPSQIYMRYVSRWLIKPSLHDGLTEAIYRAGTEHWYGGYLVMMSFLIRNGMTTRTWLGWLCVPWIAIELLIDILSPPLLIGNIILNELTILGSGLPTNEAAFAVGQWAPVVSAALVILASMLNRYLQVSEARKKATAEARESMRAKEEETGAGIQLTGVVVQKLERAETLRDPEAALVVDSRR